MLLVKQMSTDEDILDEELGEAILGVRGALEWIEQAAAVKNSYLLWKGRCLLYDRIQVLRKSLLTAPDKSPKEQILVGTAKLDLAASEEALRTASLQLSLILSAVRADAKS